MSVNNHPLIEERPMLFLFKPVPIFLSLMAAGLIGLAISLMAPDNGEWLSGLTCAFMSAITLCTGASASTTRVGIAIKTASTVFFVCALIAGCILALTDGTVRAYAITDGLIIIAFGMLIYGLCSHKQM